MNHKSRVFWRSVLVVSLLSPFVFFASSMRPWESSSSIGLIFQEILYPFEYAWNAGSGFLVDHWDHYINLSEKAKENTVLKSRLTLLETKLLDYDDKLQEIARLRELLGFSRQDPREQIVAEVIGNSRDAAFRSIRINKGDWDGIKVGMPVVTAGGVVGRIIRVGKKFSDIHILVDSNFNVDILIQRTRVRGVLKGFGDHSVLTLNRQAEIKIGDTIITSGIIGGFPKGLPIGKVVKISYESDHISQTVKVDPWVAFDRIEEVVVLKTFDAEVQKIMESAGGDWIDKQVQKEKG